MEINWTKVLLWVQLRRIPLELFTRHGTRYISSILGFPLYMDRITAERNTLEFARVCIQIDVKNEVSKFIEVVRKSG